MACKTEFSKLFTILDNSDYAIDTPFKKVIKEAVEQAGFCEVVLDVDKSTQKSTKKTTKKTTDKTTKKTQKKRKVSSYNVFVGHQIKVEGKTMAQAVGLWKELSDKEKLVWKEKADVLNQKNAKEVDSEESLSEEKSEKKKSKAKGKGKGDRKTSGYNLFISDQMKKQGKKMAEAVGLWKELSETEKQAWKDKAVVFNSEKEKPEKKGKSNGDSEATE